MEEKELLTMAVDVENLKTHCNALDEQMKKMTDRMDTYSKDNIRLESKIDNMNIEILSELKFIRRDNEQTIKRLDKIENRDYEEKTEPHRRLVDAKWKIGIAIASGIVFAIVGLAIGINI